ncbi:MAG: transcription elongation factor GreA [Porphyromonadaceae bacterium]|nr:MAG: transcription elongation factor GreA [Porphyromonadaceae bacterium]
MAISYMTQEGYDKKMQELKHLESVERPDVVRAIQEAREKGDLSENAEYDAAKERQGMLEAKIAELKTLVATARIIDQSKLQTEEVALMNKVTIKNLKNSASMTYTIVSETEANLKGSAKSLSPLPIAKGLLGHKVGDIVEVQAPVGKMQFQIVEIGV